MVPEKSVKICLLRVLPYSHTWHLVTVTFASAVGWLLPYLTVGLYSTLLILYHFYV